MFTYHTIETNRLFSLFSQQSIYLVMYVLYLKNDSTYWQTEREVGDNCLFPYITYLMCYIN